MCVVEMETYRDAYDIVWPGVERVLAMWRGRRDGVRATGWSLD